MQEHQGHLTSQQTVQVCCTTGHPSSKACLDFFCTQEASTPVAALYGPTFTAKLTIATADWLMAVGQLPDLWKQTTPYTAAPVVAPLVDKAAKAKPGGATVSLAVEGVCLDRAANVLQVRHITACWHDECVLNLNGHALLSSHGCNKS